MSSKKAAKKRKKAAKKTAAEELEKAAMKEWLAHRLVASAQQSFPESWGEETNAEAAMGAETFGEVIRLGGADSKPPSPSRVKMIERKAVIAGSFSEFIDLCLAKNLPL